MSCNEKYKYDNNLCKTHSSRCDKDQRSVCPSKLSKKELEDLYYTLLENNLELKRTVNAQNDQNRILSTKVRRMTAQCKMNGVNASSKECCVSSKSVINELNATIDNLKRSNELMAERIRKLSTQLCTAKQFLKQNPISRPCYKCYLHATNAKNQSSGTDVCVSLKSVAASAIFPNRGTVYNIRDPTAETGITASNADVNENNPSSQSGNERETDQECQETRCRSTIENLKQKIVNLEEELSKTHKEYSTRMSELEAEVNVLRITATQMRHQIAASAREDMLGMARDLKEAAAQRAELERQLSAEKKKVMELEMLIKAAELSQKVAKAMGGRCVTCSRMPMSTKISLMKAKIPPPDNPTKSDDSGCVDCHRDTECNNSTNDWLIQKIKDMQDKLDKLKMPTTGTGKGASLCSKASSPKKCKTCSTIVPIFPQKSTCIRKAPQKSIIGMSPCCKSSSNVEKLSGGKECSITATKRASSICERSSDDENWYDEKECTCATTVNKSVSSVCGRSDDGEKWCDEKECKCANTVRTQICERSSDGEKWCDEKECTFTSTGTKRASYISKISSDGEKWCEEKECQNPTNVPKSPQMSTLGPSRCCKISSNGEHWCKADECKCPPIEYKCSQIHRENIPTKDVISTNRIICINKTGVPRSVPSEEVICKVKRYDKPVKNLTCDNKIYENKRLPKKEVICDHKQCVIPIKKVTCDSKICGRKSPESDKMATSVQDLSWLIKRITEMQEMEKKLLIPSGETLYNDKGASSISDENWCGEKDCVHPSTPNKSNRFQIIVPKFPPLPICSDPECIPKKPVCTDDSCENTKTDQDRDSCDCIENDKRKLDDSPIEQAVYNANEEGHGLNLSKESRERFSFSESEQEVPMKCNQKVNEFDTFNNAVNVLNEMSNTKSEVSQVTFKYGQVNLESGESKPETPRENIKDESNATEASISHTLKPSTPKHDDHDSHQILRSLPVCSDPVTKPNKIGTANWKKAKLHGKKKAINVVEDTKTNKIVKTAAKNEDNGSVVKKLTTMKNNKGKKVDNSKSENLTKTYDVKNIRKSKDSVSRSKHVNKKRKPSRDKKEKLDIVNEYATLTNAVNDERPKDQVVFEAGDVENKNSQLDEIARMEKISNVDEFGSVLKCPPMGASTPAASPRTYSVSRGAGADDTDCEISGMTDLPAEEVDTAATPRDILSPGEHKTIATSTESASVYNDFTLSEGEVPAGTYSIRRMSKSVGEVGGMDVTKEDRSIGERRSAARMEEALQAVTRELARCRSLLLRPRHREHPQRMNAATSFDLNQDSLVVLKSKAKSSETNCAFVLHISTIRLADEVVAWTCDSHLMLKWKFLTLKTVTHMGVGAVIDIGFTARYTIQVNKNSMNYFTMNSGECKKNPQHTAIQQ